MSHGRLHDHRAFAIQLPGQLHRAYQLYASPEIRLWFHESIAFIALQYGATYACVLAYLMRTRIDPAVSPLVWTFAVLGLPFGVATLDMLMFLEPLTLLPALRRLSDSYGWYARA